MSADESKHMARLKDFAHEVRTPLNAVVGYTHMLSAAKERNLSLDQVEDYGATAHEAAVRMVKICERMLEEEVSGETVIHIEEVDFNKMADTILQEFGPAARAKGLQLRVDIDDDFPILTTDALLLNQALTNLVSNAIKFTQSGGAVDILGRVDPVDNAVILVVQDDGKGIAPWLMSRLMTGDQVTTIDPASFAIEKGWGRGFQIVRKFAERLNATLEIESEEGQGTIVSLRMNPKGPHSPD